MLISSRTSDCLALAPALLLLQEKWDEELGNSMRLNTRRYQMLLSEAVEQCLPMHDADLAERDVLDVLLEQRMQSRDGEQVRTPAIQALPGMV